MKAIVQNRYGSPDVLELRDVDTPSIGDDGVLVEVHAASVNALDWHLTRGKPYAMRMLIGLKPKNALRGVDVSGRVAAVGKNVTRLRAGDEVFGAANGSFAEFAASTERQLAVKPPTITHEQAATLNVAGLTALQGLRDRAGLRTGQRVLVNGAGGGVGTFAVQIAKHLGAHVTAVTRTDNLDFVRSLGADEAIDYTAEDFTRRGGDRWNVIYDIGGGRPLLACRRVLTRDGTFVAIGAPAGQWFSPMSRLLHVMLLSPFVAQRFAPFVAATKPEDLTLLAELTAAGTITPAIDRTYPLAETPAAIARVGAGAARGKVVVSVR